MGYELVVTERAEEMLDRLMYCLLSERRNEPAAIRLMDGIGSVYGCLSHDPWQFPVSGDRCLSGKGYREAAVPGTDYMVVFYVDRQTAVVLGIFHPWEIPGRDGCRIAEV